jgi:hypothetical protein
MADLPSAAPRLLRATLPAEFVSTPIRMMMAPTPTLTPATRPQPGIFHRFVYVGHT